jgi:hypothetical protein
MIVLINMDSVTMFVKMQTLVDKLKFVDLIFHVCILDINIYNQMKIATNTFNN